MRFLCYINRKAEAGAEGLMDFVEAREPFALQIVLFLLLLVPFLFLVLIEKGTRGALPEARQARRVLALLGDRESITYTEVCLALKFTSSEERDETFRFLTVNKILSGYTTGPSVIGQPYYGSVWRKL